MKRAPRRYVPLRNFLALSPANSAHLKTLWEQTNDDRFQSLFDTKCRQWNSQSPPNRLCQLFMFGCSSCAGIGSCSTCAVTVTRGSGEGKGFSPSPKGLTHVKVIRKDRNDDQQKSKRFFVIVFSRTQRSEPWQAAFASIQPHHHTVRKWKSEAGSAPCLRHYARVSTAEKPTRRPPAIFFFVYGTSPFYNHGLATNHKAVAFAAHHLRE